MANEISLVTYNESLVTPKHDAVIHDMAVENGILYGCKITIKDATTLHMTAGMGIVYGRQFELYESDITVPLADTTVSGRLYVHVDLGNVDEPVQLLVETGASLSELVDNPGINVENSATDMELATFEVTTETIGTLKMTYKSARRNEERFAGFEAEFATLNDRLGKKMDKMSMFSPKGIWCSTFVESNYKGNTSVLLKRQDEALTVDTMNKYFGTNYTAAQAVTHFVVLAMNGDGDACGVHISGVQFIPSAKWWVATAEDSLTGKTFRINWVAIHF